MEEERKIGRPKSKVAPEPKRARGRPRKAEPAEPEVKRPRGRPKKETAEPVSTEKRARGRPRKYPPKDETAEKRPRGRPRKNEVRATTEPEVKRPRGRPKKELITADKAVLEGNHPYTDIPQNPVAPISQYIEIPTAPETVREDVDTADKAVLANGHPYAEVAPVPNVDWENVDLDDVFEEITPIEKPYLDTEDEVLEKGEAYKRLKERATSIIASKEHVKPAKHMADNLLKDDRPLPPIIATPPLAKMNISTPKTPVKKASKPVPKVILKANPMPNMVIVITGATSGMGFAMAKKLAGLGHIVIAVGRKPGLSRDARDEILDTYPDANIHYLIADLSLMSQVRILAEEIQEKVFELGRECVDCIIHNAAEDLDASKLTYENLEYMWATNYLSVVLLTKLIQPLLDASRNAKVITFTTRRASQSAKINWRYLRDRSGKFASKIYEQTKLADLMFALEYDHQHADRDDIHAYCVDPGNVNTTLRTRNASGIRHFHFDFWRKKGKSIEDGIKTAVYLVLSKNLPTHTVLYHDMRAVEPSKFALDQENRKALMKVTEMELRENNEIKIK